VQAVQSLKAELAKKEDEVRDVTAKLNEASKSLASKMEAINSYRKASNALRQQITAHADKQKV
jgi:uncharacterized protein involved in exopolysaccharide biosynthesis